MLKPKNYKFSGKFASFKKFNLQKIIERFKIFARVILLGIVFLQNEKKRRTLRSGLQIQQVGGGGVEREVSGQVV